MRALTKTEKISPGKNQAPPDSLWHGHQFCEMAWLKKIRPRHPSLSGGNCCGGGFSAQPPFLQR
jgi:hypothetical protein